MKALFAAVASVAIFAAASATLAQSDVESLLGEVRAALEPANANYGVAIPIRIAVSDEAGLDNETVQMLVGSPDVLLAAAREVDPKAKESLKFGEVLIAVDGVSVPCKVAFAPKGERKHIGRSSIAGSLMVDVGPPLETPGPGKSYVELCSSFREVARRLGVGVSKSLEQSLRSIARRQADRKTALHAELDQAYERKAKELQSDIERLVAKRNSIGELPETVLVQTIGDLGKQKQELELEQAGLEARSQALELQVRQNLKRIDELSQQDEVAANFRRVVELRERRLKELEAIHAAGRVGKDSLNQAEVDLASAKVELSQAMRGASIAGSQELQRLNTELAKTAVSTAECQAKLKFLSEQLQGHLQTWNLERTRGEALRADISVVRKLSAALAEELQHRKLAEIPASVVDVSVDTFWNPENENGAPR